MLETTSRPGAQEQHEDRSEAPLNPNLPDRIESSRGGNGDQNNQTINGHENSRHPFVVAPRLREPRRQVDPNLRVTALRPTYHAQNWVVDDQDYRTRGRRDHLEHDDDITRRVKVDVPTTFDPKGFH